MAIRRVRIKNFRGFRDETLELGNFNVLIGANASGKSSVIQAFQFIRDLVEFGLDDAVSMQGGAEYLRNIQEAPDSPFEIEMSFDFNAEGETVFRETEHDESYGSPILVDVQCNSATYSLTVRFDKESVSDYEETLTVQTKLGTSSHLNKPDVYHEDAQLIMVNKDQKTSRQWKLSPSSPLKYLDEWDNLSARLLLEKGNLAAGRILQLPVLFLYSQPRDVLESIGIFDLDPRLPKRSAPVAGRADLDPDGGNLAIVLKRILENDEERKTLVSILQDLLPFAQDMKIERLVDRSVYFKLSEKYAKDYLPASLLSDGTINITALIVALLFQRREVVIIEEPERNLHPELIEKVISLMVDVSEQRQLIISTHSMEVLRHTDLADLLLVSRDKDGYSTVEKPADNWMVQRFLENDMGIDELFVQGLLGSKA